MKICVSVPGQLADAAERQTIIGHLRRLGDTAGECGVTLALETHKGPTQNADAMLALMSEVDHSHVRLNFDTGNIAYYNKDTDPCDELDKVKHLVRNVHLKDNRGGYEDQLPGRGRQRGRRFRTGFERFWTAWGSPVRTRLKSRGLAASRSQACPNKDRSGSVVPPFI